MHHLFAAAGLFALVAFAFGERAAKAVAQIAVVTAGLGFLAIVTWVLIGQPAWLAN